MGAHMARNLVSEGHKVTVYDVRPEAIEVLVELGAEAASSPEAVAPGAEAVFTSLPGPPEVNAVWQGESGLLANMEPDAIGIDLSTVDPDTARQVAAEAAERGVRFMDCPVSGGVNGAEAGTLSLMAGGPRQTFDDALPALEAIGRADKIYHCGDVGSGSVVKLVNNLISQTTNTVISEAFTMGVKAGVDANTLIDVVQASSGGSATLAQWGDSVLKRNFEPGFMLALGAKDVRLAHELAASLDIPMPVTAAGKARIDRGVAEGLGAETSQAVVKMQENDAGIEVDGRKSN